MGDCGDYRSLACALVFPSVCVSWHRLVQNAGQAFLRIHRVTYNINLHNVTCMPKCKVMRCGTQYTPATCLLDVLDDCTRIGLGHKATDQEVAIQQTLMANAENCMLQQMGDYKGHTHICTRINVWQTSTEIRNWRCSECHVQRTSVWHVGDKAHKNKSRNIQFTHMYMHADLSDAQNRT